MKNNNLISKTHNRDKTLIDLLHHTLAHMTFICACRSNLLRAISKQASGMHALHIGPLFDRQSVRASRSIDVEEKERSSKHPPLILLSAKQQQVHYLE